MPFTGSEKDLKARILTELESLLPDDETKELALKRMDKIAEALANAVVGWILANGSQSIQATVIGSGTGTATGVGNMGAPVISTVNTSTQGQVDTTTAKLV